MPLLRVRLSDEEYELIKNSSVKHNTTMSGYIKSLIKEKAVKTPATNLIPPEKKSPAKKDKNQEVVEEVQHNSNTHTVSDDKKDAAPKEDMKQEKRRAPGPPIGLHYSR